MADNESSGRFRLPFSELDLTSYVFPGATFVVSCYTFEYWVTHGPTAEGLQAARQTLHTPVLTALWHIAPFSPSDAGSATAGNGAYASTWILHAAYLVALVVIALLVGHLLATISSFLWERVLVGKGHGFPSETLFGPSRDETYTQVIRRAQYRGIYWWFNLALIVFYIGLAFAAPVVTVMGVVLFAVWVAFVGLKFNREWRLHKLYDLPDTQLLPDIESPAYRTLVRWWAKPYDLFASYYSWFFRTGETLSVDLRERIAATFENVFDISWNESPSNRYWLVFSYLSENSRILRDQLGRWRMLYVFARNMATAFWCAFIYCVLWMWLQHENLPDTDYALRCLPLLLGGAALLLTLRYYYIFVCYYSRYVFRAFFAFERGRALGAGSVKAKE